MRPLTGLSSGIFPVNPDNELIQRQQLLIRPGPPEDKITSIIIDYMINNRDSSVQKYAVAG